jgi:outer membrane cobalamin receptor
LRRVNCFTGSADGDWNTASQQSLKRFNKYPGATFDVKVASADVLDAIKAEPARTCPCLRSRSREGMASAIVAPGFTIVYLRGDYAIDDRVKLSRVDNLFNLHYQNPTGFLAPGFGIFGGIRVASYGVQ